VCSVLEIIMVCLLVEKFIDQAHSLANVVLVVAVVPIDFSQNQPYFQGVRRFGDLLNPGVIYVQLALDVDRSLVYFDLHLSYHLTQHLVHSVFDEVVVKPNHCMQLLLDLLEFLTHFA